jgi:hypothetical protein
LKQVPFVLESRFWAIAKLIALAYSCLAKLAS